MKRAHASNLLFLGAWLAVSMAGYMASRASVFAAGGQNNCVPCKDCEMMDTFWSTDSDGNNYYGGTVWQNSESPASTAYVGTNGGNTDDLYGTGCDGTSSQEVMENQIEIVSYTSAADACTITPAGPYPPGTYKCENGQNIDLSGNLAWPSICTNP